ncbi:MAG: DUF3365 domain-containing protein [Saprospiraceae bacterium]|nr:DUF3365 domain-containing protein [Saprospiraceae bacterium]
MRISILALLSLFGLLLACTPSSNPQPVESFDPLPWLEKGSMVQASSFAVLSTKLKGVMEKQGIGEAIQYCSLSAQSLTDTLSRMYGCTIRRATLQTRNPVNQANDYEAAILADWAADLKAGKELTAVVQELTPDTVMYYAPIRMQPLCLNCHGTVGTEITAANYGLIQQRYPEDQATGYAVGDLRGMWSIQFVQ